MKQISNYSFHFENSDIYDRHLNKTIYLRLLYNKAKRKYKRARVLAVHSIRQAPVELLSLFLVHLLTKSPVVEDKHVK